MSAHTGSNQRLLLRIGRAAHSGPDFPTLCRQVAEAIHEEAGWQRIRLTASPGSSLSPPGFVIEFSGPLGAAEPLASAGGPPGSQGGPPRPGGPGDPPGPSAEEQRLLDQGYGTFLDVPLVCRGQEVGRLHLAGRQGSAVRSWELKFLDDLGGLLGLALDDLAARARVAELEPLQRERAYLRDELKTDRDLRLLTGESPAMKAVRLAIQQVAPTDSTVLIQGETGTGKELVARAIHQLSPRRDHLLVAVNCAALAPSLIASELFGHEPGAFTGATRRRIGRFELAHRGTLFLDEVGELPAETQVMLLRVLQERVLERVGGHDPVTVDVRVVAATHQDLTAALHQGRFRVDLFYRLNVFPIRVPPLRERRQDIPDLVRHFVHHFGRRLNKPIARVSPAAIQVLTAYDWPGNVRELENLIERAMIIASGDTLEVDPNWLGRAPAPGPPTEGRMGLAELERHAILEALQRCHGRVYGSGGAAAALGLKPTTLYGKMRKHRIARNPALQEPGAERSAPPHGDARS